MPSRSKWPARVWIVRHGESIANVATHAAVAAAEDRIAVAIRDVDVPLSPTGEAQARSVGRWFATLDPETRPERILASPYVRTRRTAELIVEAAGLDCDIHVDERLRERDMGVLERLTHKGIADLEPEQAEFRRLLGKFYHRPPGGESWTDVILRLRGFLDSFALHHDNRRVLIVCHQVVILCLRYIFERLDEAAILAIDAEGTLANGGITEYQVADIGGEARLALVRYNEAVDP